MRPHPTRHATVHTVVRPVLVDSGAENGGSISKDHWSGPVVGPAYLAFPWVSQRRLRPARRPGYGCDVVPESTVVKRTVSIDGRKTNISLEDAFWDALSDIANARNITRKQILEEVDKQRQGNLSSALRMFALEYYRSHSKPPRK